MTLSTETKQYGLFYIGKEAALESTLHQQLKSLYGDDDDSREVVVDGFRIDAIHDGRLVEVQCASLSAIRAKVANLLERHHVHVV